MDNFSNRQFVEIEGMSGNEIKDMKIDYSFAECPFGKILVASTAKGICSIALANDEVQAVRNLAGEFPGSTLIYECKESHEKLKTAFSGDLSEIEKIKLHLKGTKFQLAVWNALLEVPFGKLCSYGDIAKKIGHPKAFRAVGTAVGKNPAFFVVPCHRIIKSSGEIGHYYWGTDIKKQIIDWEASRMK